MWIIKTRWSNRYRRQREEARYLVIEEDREQAERLITEKNPHAEILFVQPVEAGRRIFQLP